MRPAVRAGPFTAEEFMALVITQAPKLDLEGTRWVDIDKGVKIKIGSAGNPKFKSHHALIQRH